MPAARWLRVVAAFVAGLALVAGCRGDDEGTPPATQRPAQQETGVQAPGIIAFRRYSDLTESQGLIYTIRPDGTGERQVTRPPEGSTDEFPQVSPDGRRIAFERCSETAPCQVHTAAIDGSDPRRLEVTCTLKPVCDTSSAAWHPDGTRLVITRASGRERQLDDGDTWIQRSELVEIGLDGGAGRTIARVDDWEGDLQSASWSPDGRRLAADRFYSPRHPTPGRRVVLVPASGGTPEAVTPHALNAGDGPEWAPDGDLLLFRSQADSEEGIGAQLVTSRPGGSELHRYDPFGDRRAVRSSAWSPDGRWIVFAAAGTNGLPDVFVMRADGTDPKPLTRTRLTDSAPDWAGG